MTACCDSNQETAIVWGEDGHLEATITRAAGSNVSIQDATLTFTIGPNYTTPIQTVPDPQITKTTNTESQIIATFQIDEALLADNLPKTSQLLFWDLVVATVAGASVKLQGSIPLRDGFSGNGDIVAPDTIDQSTILTYEVLDPRDFADGQVPSFNAGTNSFDAVTLSGGGGGTSFQVSAPAGEALSALRVAVKDNGQLVYADPANVNHQQAALGILIAAATQGQTAIAYLKRIVFDASWNWNPALPIWLGDNGTLTQTAPKTSPTDALYRIMARVIDPQTIDFQPEEGIPFGY